jgi:hypothetical protein
MMRVFLNKDWVQDIAHALLFGIDQVWTSDVQKSLNKRPFRGIFKGLGSNGRKLSVPVYLISQNR